MSISRSLRLIAAAAILPAFFVLVSCSSSSNPASSTGGGGGGTMSTSNAISISGFAFSPASTTVKSGTVVTWTNKDGVSHTVTSNNGGFPSSGNIAPNGTYVVTFTATGTYNYHCSIHPSMTGTVTVTQ